MQQMQVQVPEGVTYGMTFTIMANGQQMQIQCPANTAPGQMITISVPAPTPMVTAVAMPMTQAAPMVQAMPMAAAQPMHHAPPPRNHNYKPPEQVCCGCEKNCCIIALLMGAALTGLVGMGLLIGGGGVTSATSERDAVVDFASIAGGCVVRDIKNWQRTEDDRDDKKCFDVFEYEFCLGTREGLGAGRNGTCGLWSKTHEQEACSDRICSSCTRATTPAFSRGENTPCWRPSPGYEPGFPYACGRPDGIIAGSSTACIKIFECVCPPRPAPPPPAARYAAPPCPLERACSRHTQS